MTPLCFEECDHRKKKRRDVEQTLKDDKGTAKADKITPFSPFECEEGSERSGVR